MCMPAKVTRVHTRAHTCPDSHVTEINWKPSGCVKCHGLGESHPVAQKRDLSSHVLPAPPPPAPSWLLSSLSVLQLHRTTGLSIRTLLGFEPAAN